MPDTLPKELFPFGMQKVPGSRPGSMLDLFYSMGMPGVWTKNGGYRSIYQDMMNQNLMKGQAPFTGFPAGWGQGSGSSASSAESADKKDDPLAGMPEWYVNWYNTRGKTGGILDD